MIQLACTHCSHRFELEMKEGALCPSCGWSSSVVPASDLLNQSKSTAKVASAPSVLSGILGFLIFILKFLGIAVLVLLLVWGVVSLVKKSKSGRGQLTLSQAKPLDIQGHLPQVSKSVPSELSEAELTELNSPLTLSAEVQLSDDDQKLLQDAVDLNAGNVEKLPSVNWTLDQLKQFIEAQEKNFHMPLPRSYKKDLEELFQKNYVPAYDLFLAGKIQQARDAYVASLGFPIYGNDIRKHRAVILTMIRDFLNDTIAKIGAMNFALARLSSNALAEQTSILYESIQAKIRAGQWSDSLVDIEKLESLLPAVGGSVVQAPAYSAGFEKVDADIQPVLMKLLQVPAWAFDLNELKSDLQFKRAVLLKLTDVDRKVSIESYAKAVEKIKQKLWVEAIPFLREVKSPDELKQNADQKIILIQKLIGGSAESMGN